MIVEEHTTSHASMFTTIHKCWLLYVVYMCLLVDPRSLVLVFIKRTFEKYFAKLVIKMYFPYFAKAVFTTMKSSAWGCA